MRSSIVYSFAAALAIVYICSLCMGALWRSNVDLEDFISWFTFIITHPFPQGLTAAFSNYNPPFIYLLNVGALTKDWAEPAIILQKSPLPWR